MADGQFMTAVAYKTVKDVTEQVIKQLGELQGHLVNRCTPTDYEDAELADSLLNHLAHVLAHALVLNEKNLGQTQKIRLQKITSLCDDAYREARDFREVWIFKLAEEEARAKAEREGGGPA